MTLEDKRNFVIDYEARFCYENYTFEDFQWIMRHGFKGYKEYDQEAINKFYEDLTEE